MYKLLLKEIYFGKCIHCQNKSLMGCLDKTSAYLFVIRLLIGLDVSHHAPVLLVHPNC